MANFRMRRGKLHLPQHKNTGDLPTAHMPSPKKVTVSMQQHIGAPCEPLVKKGDAVFVGTKIGDTDKFVSVPVHSSVSGRVTGVKNLVLPRGGRVKAVEIESDGADTPDPAIAKPAVTDTASFISALKSSGLVGLGGAGFGTWLKLSPSKDARIDTLIVNAVECEPYITSDYRQIIEEPDRVVDGIAQIQKYIPVKTIHIALKTGRGDAVSALEGALSRADAELRKTVKISQMRPVYPLGAEKVLLYELTGRALPPGKIPAFFGCLVINVSTVAFISSYLNDGMPLVRRRVTVDGTAVASPQNVMAPVGASVEDIVSFLGGFREKPAKIILGGPMTGPAVDSASAPISKPDNAILAFREGDARVRAPSACIRCGRCVEACPIRLSPVGICERQEAAGSGEALYAAGAHNCMECGCCSYVCPANRRVVQSVKLAKNKAIDHSKTLCRPEGK